MKKSLLSIAVLKIGHKFLSNCILGNYKYKVLQKPRTILLSMKLPLYHIPSHISTCTYRPDLCLRAGFGQGYAVKYTFGVNITLLKIARFTTKDYFTVQSL